MRYLKGFLGAFIAVTFVFAAAAFCNREDYEVMVFIPQYFLVINLALSLVLAEFTFFFEFPSWKYWQYAALNAFMTPVIFGTYEMLLPGVLSKEQFIFTVIVLLCVGVGAGFGYRLAAGQLPPDEE